MNQFERAIQKAEKSRERRGLPPIDMRVGQIADQAVLLTKRMEKPQKSDAEITVTVNLGDVEFVSKFRARNFRGNHSPTVINEQGIRRVMREALSAKLGRIDDLP